MHPRQWTSAPALVLALLLVPVTIRAHEADPLSVPVAADARAQLWPLAVTAEILTPGAGRPRAHAVVVADGHQLKFQQVVRTSRGEREFVLAVTPRHHPRSTVELEWELRVSESRYEFGSGVEGWRRYLLHRLGLGPRPDLGPAVLRTVEADIVPTRGEPLVHAITVGQDTYHLRLVARSMRG